PGGRPAGARHRDGLHEPAGARPRPRGRRAGRRRGGAAGRAGRRADRRRGTRRPPGHDLVRDRLRGGAAGAPAVPVSGAGLARLVAPLAPLAAVPGAAWAVGGGLRDALLGRPVADLDLAVAGDAARFAAALARAHGADRFRLSREFGSWSITGGTLPMQVDITPLQGP